MFTDNKETNGFLLFVAVFIIARLGVLLKKSEKILEAIAEISNKTQIPKKVNLLILLTVIPI